MIMNAAMGVQNMELKLRPAVVLLIIKNVDYGGVAYKNTSGVVTDEYACFVTLGTILTGAPYLIQEISTSASVVDFEHVVTGQSFGVNELVHIYQQGVFDKRTYAKIFLREAAYTYDEADNIDIGYPVLTYKKYNFPITHSVDPKITIDDATLDLYAGMSETDELFELSKSR